MAITGGKTSSDSFVAFGYRHPWSVRSGSPDALLVLPGNVACRLDASRVGSFLRTSCCPAAAVLAIPGVIVLELPSGVRRPTRAGNSLAEDSCGERCDAAAGLIVQRRIGVDAVDDAGGKACC